MLSRSPLASQLSSAPHASYALGMNSEGQSRRDGAGMVSGPTDPRRTPSIPRAHMQLAGAGPVLQPHSFPHPLPPSPASVSNHSIIPIHSGEHPPPLPLLPNAFVFPRRGCSAPACIHASATCCTSLEPTASQKDRERESEQWCCGWALPLCPRALGTAPACCPQRHQGDGAAVCTKLAKVRAAVRGAGCVNAIF